MIIVILVLVGLILGSFINASVWRLHEQSKKKLSNSQKKELSILQGRSMCPNCRHKLSANDLVPIISWLELRGKCRYCNKPIGWIEPFGELLTVGLFLFSYFFWPLTMHGVGLFEFIVWLIALLGFIALGIYDARWQILPNKIVYPLIALIIIQIVAIMTFFNGDLSLLLGSIWGALVLGGIFYVLFQVSQGRWIGGGDVKLGVVLGLFVGGPLSSILLLFIASSLGTLFALPLLASKKTKINSKVPFGPFLLIAAVLVRLFGHSVTGWYKHHYL